MVLSSKRQRWILKMTPDWMAGKLTVYQVAKRAGVEQHTAKIYLERFKTAIDEQTKNVEHRILEQAFVSTHKPGIWKRITMLLIGSKIDDQREKEPISATTCTE